MKYIVALLSSVLLAGAVTLAVPASASTGHHRGHVTGVCVRYASIGGIDQDIRVVSSIYTPAPSGRPCARGDTLVAAGAIETGRGR